MGEPATLADHLRWAVMEGKLDKVKEYLDLFTVDDDQQIYTRAMAAKRAKLEILDKESQLNLFSLAIEKQHQEIIELLVAKGFPVNFDDLEVVPLLQEAVDTGDIEIVKFLLKTGANVSAVSRRRFTILDLGSVDDKLPYFAGTCALHRAATKSEELVLLLLDYGADVFQLNTSTGLTAMHYAASAGNLDIVKLLFDRGLSAEQCDNIDRSPVCYAVEYGRKDAFLFLLERVSKENLQSIIQGTLSNCFEFGQTDVIEILVNLNGGVNAVIPVTPFAPPLHFACFYGNESVARTLINQGADVHSVNGVGTTTLYTAVEVLELEIAKLLLDHGVDVNRRVNHQKTALHKAAKNGAVNLIQLLVEYGADILAKDDSGKTPLDYALERHFTDSAKVLIKRLVETHHHNLNDCGQDLSMINEQLNLKIYYDKCVEELTTIKNETIEDSFAVYYNAMKPNNLAALVPLARNLDICKAFELSNLDSKFPIFGSTLYKHFEEAVARKPLENKGRRVFCSFYDKNDEKLPHLPEAFADQVFTYLSNDDLNNLTLKF